MTDTASIDFYTTDDTRATPAGIFGLNDTQISLAPNSTGEAAMDCQIPTPMNVFAVFGHMHQLGTTLDLSSDGGTLFSESWNFNDQPTVPRTFTLNTGDSVHRPERLEAGP